ncbi:glycoside hydrolase family 43 protein [Paenibacillus septentrionalis]|uniref:Glycoside hydrolase family 43 protein n=1 Tax=Paenibacillus septentrionalis TaxID=429342 RepID=A0ABW1V6T2_9BACL
MTNTKTVQYRNPVLSGFYPDPSAIRVGEDFYMVTSTFEYFPGVPIFHSKDLVNWEQIGHVLHRESQVNLLSRKSSQGIYAPVLRYHDGLFYMITTDVYGIGNFFVTAANPAGPWSDPIRIPHGGIDPSLFFDDDGKVYVSVQSGFAETSHVIQYEINPKTGEALTEPVVVFEGDEGPWVEGPHLYKINGMYYMMTASGGTGPMHREIIGRSSNPYGPFEMLEHPILTHNALKDHPIQYTGHAELLDDVDGNWWVLFLGVRLFNERGSVLGRETFLAPVTWVDGWPMVDNNEGHVGLEMKVTVPTKQDADVLIQQQEQPKQLVISFSASEPLSMDWIYSRVLPKAGAVSTSSNDGYLTLVGNEKALHDGQDTVYVSRRQLDHEMRFETALSYQPEQEGEAAGIAARLSDHSYYAIALTKQDGKLAVQATLMRNQQEEQTAVAAIDAEAYNTNGSIKFAIQSTLQEYSLLYTVDGENWHTLATAPANDITPDSGGSFTGVTLGMFAHGTASGNSAPAQFSYFKYEAM